MKKHTIAHYYKNQYVSKKISIDDFNFVKNFVKNFGKNFGKNCEKFRENCEKFWEKFRKKFWKKFREKFHEKMHTIANYSTLLQKSGCLSIYVVCYNFS